MDTKKTVIGSTDHSPLRLDERSVHAVHLVVETAGVAQVVARAIPSPQGRGHGPAVHTLPALHVRPVLLAVCKTHTVQH